MKRIGLAALAIALLGAVSALSPSAVQAQEKTLKVVPASDLKILDPSFTTAYITRNFGYMVYDMPFGLDANQPKGQMVDKYVRSDDGRSWTFTLRPGLKFSDGTPVTAADMVASMQRWTAKDSLGRAMTAISAGEWSVVNPTTFALTLKEPFPMVLEAMSKPSGFPPIVMPERLAKMPLTSPINDVLGSGPFVFKRDEWVPGNKVVFVRNPHYVARDEPSERLAGSKSPQFDRVEWLYIPDANSAVAALRKGEVDLIEQVPPDHIATLRDDPNVRLQEAGAWQGFLVMNQLHPPFNNPKIRQAVQKAVDQERFMAAMAFPKELRMAHCATFFICGSAYETFAGSDPWRKADPAAAKKMLAEAGYNGEKVVVLVPSDVPYLNAEALMAAQTLRSIGMNVDMQTSDWASVTARRAKREAPEAGGWSMYVTVASSFDADSPINNAYLSATCGTSLPGWPCDKQLDDLRSAWLKEMNPTRRKELLDQFHARAFEAVPYVNAGQYSAVFGVRKEIKGVEKMWNGLPLVWNLSR